jgi:maleate isomerase
VLSCTDMRAVEVINQLEQELGKPVVTSNQAILYAALQHTEVSPSEVFCGHLFNVN